MGSVCFGTDHRHDSQMGDPSRSLKWELIIRKAALLVESCLVFSFEVDLPFVCVRVPELVRNWTSR